MYVCVILIDFQAHRDAFIQNISRNVVRNTVHVAALLWCKPEVVDDIFSVSYSRAVSAVICRRLL